LGTGSIADKEGLVTILIKVVSNIIELAIYASEELHALEQQYGVFSLVIAIFERYTDLSPKIVSGCCRMMTRLCNKLDRLGMPARQTLEETLGTEMV
jgi:hypothetical protein